MALTPSNKLSKGTKAPNFTLPNVVTGNAVSLEEIKGKKGTVVLFICNHCPFVIHINPLLVALANEYQAKGIGFVAISSNDVENYPQDAPDLMKIHAEENNYSFPYLYDETQQVAKEYDAACTPDVYVFDKELKLYYHGQLDNSRPGNGIPSTGNNIKSILENLGQAKLYLGEEKPSVGCGIKWK
ncbi:thiol-disulfide isomerase/thioredoxin [Wenyingzhuangia heitensis]|uniref:Thiol-disulfide isomerase/thioredoxin n=1 Tax=Wenyingzhuangia heitensis TaxID=1487859 RepID=A0ABX0U5Y4_9FLAO|nr:thioredoxin family protein [Wenyingzhuangia heitensis]NIJ44257.1 thiol-disulfide isomerase/thioredoxin [Wenyingzhuangia heitensis]